MKKVLLSVFVISFLYSHAQLTTPPSGGNKKAVVGERIGLTDVTIHYDRPGVKGREGKIWGQLVHTGFIDQQFGSSNAAPWRAGANECTTIEFSGPVKSKAKIFLPVNMVSSLRMIPMHQRLFFRKMQMHGEVIIITKKKMRCGYR